MVLSFMGQRRMEPIGVFGTALLLITRSWSTGHSE